MKDEYKERRAAKHAAEQEAKQGQQKAKLRRGDVPQTMAFFKRTLDAKTEIGTPLQSQASEMIERGGWDGIGYLLVATRPDLQEQGETDIARKRCVYKVQGDAAILDFQGWFRERVAQGWAPGWRFYVTTKRVPMTDDEFKGQLVYSKVSDSGSVFVEFVTSYVEGMPPAMFREFAQVLADAMNVQEVADLFLFGLAVAQGGGGIAFKLNPLG
jgi:hypothetical protein